MPMQLLGRFRGSLEILAPQAKKIFRVFGRPHASEEIRNSTKDYAHARGEQFFEEISAGRAQRESFFGFTLEEPHAPCREILASKDFLGWVARGQPHAREEIEISAEE